MAHFTGKRICRTMIVAMFAAGIVVGGISFANLNRSCGDHGKPFSGNVLYTCANGKVNSLDPGLSADLTSASMVAALYDTLLEYDYAKRPYELVPAMLEKFPQIEESGTCITCVLRDDLVFNDDTCFRSGGGGEKDTAQQQRRVTSRDVVFSFLRLADARLRSPGNWLWRGKIKGIDDFNKRTSLAKHNDYSPYDIGCEGLTIIDDKTFKITLTVRDSRFLYLLAMPYASVMSRTAVEFYGESIAEHPVGTGAFILKEWDRDYKIVLDCNPEYRAQFYDSEENGQIKKMKLPLLERVVCYLVKNPLSTWLMFLQGELDMSALDKESFDAVVNKNQELVSSLASRGIHMTRAPSLEIVYVGFNHLDPLLGTNLDLRRALSLAYNVEARIKHSNGLMIQANGPIPPEAIGYDGAYQNPYGKMNLPLARELLEKAGFPGGMDPKTGKQLELTFDLGYTESHYRQLAELMVNDMREIGVVIKPVLNNKPRFFQKLREGQVQLFHLSWVGDYPDAENFLQLFYGANAGTCNRSNFKDAEYDHLYERVKEMPDSLVRTALYSEMAKYLTRKCPWIFEGYPVSYKLTHNWLGNYLPHDFAFNRWKYLSVDPSKRDTAKKGFAPISMGEMEK